MYVSQMLANAQRQQHKRQAPGQSLFVRALRSLLPFAVLRQHERQPTAPNAQNINRIVTV